MHTIEYIGPRPRKPVRKSRGGGWLMVLLVVIGVGIASRPLINKALADRAPVTEPTVDETVSWLEQNNGFGNRLAAAALNRTHEAITYDNAYYNISYPMGDIPADKGTCTDLVIRSYRALNIDLQQLVHEDMQVNFRLYPQLWGANQPDANIDHRRVPNLQRFFARYGEEASLKDNQIASESCHYGDVIVWRLPHGDTHAGIVVPGPGNRKHEKWIVHNIGSGPQWENKLIEYQIVGLYRYSGMNTVAHYTR
ncbi:MAG: DUF1287 domain-containing protein [Akkermansiaceae bacterium]|nr:DUF1287 domain-containing protein [Akkermansiaceae bacterium]